MGGDALFWALGFSFQPSAERPELETSFNQSATVRKSRKPQLRGSSCTLAQSDVIQGAYSSGFWPSLILTAQRNGLATSMNCSGFNRGGSEKNTTEELITAARTPDLASDRPFTRTLWLVRDHHLSRHAEEFPLGHRCRWRGWFQRARPGSCQQDDVAVQQREAVLAQNL